MSRSTIARINPRALQHNLRMLRQRAPQARVVAVIKADGYGHGLLTAAKALHGADMLAVATVEEGLNLRHSGIAAPILVLEGFHNQDELAGVCREQLVPVMHAAHQLQVLDQAGEIQLEQAWLKLDTGMHRLGFPAADAANLLHKLQPRVQQPVVLMTHLANSERDCSANARQLKQFDQAVAGLMAAHSIANSAAAWSLPETRRDWIRPGIMLYGISPFTDQTGDQLGLQPVMQLSSELIAMRDCQAGDRVGYGSRFECRQAIRIGVVAIGYGDGYPRHVRDGTPVWVAGHRAQIAGIPSMDMLTIALPRDSQAKVGDPVELWGQHIAVEEVAAWSDTIAYELVCQVKSRVKFQII